jgi:hypothetical protein
VEAKVGLLPGFSASYQDGNRLVGMLIMELPQTGQVGRKKDDEGAYFRRHIPWGVLWSNQNFLPPTAPGGQVVNNVHGISLQVRGLWQLGALHL